MAGLLSSAPPARAASSVTTSIVRTDPRTGKLVRTMVVSAKRDRTPSDAAEPQKLQQMIDEIAERNEVEPPLVHSVIRAESNYNPLAVSNKGAQGLMQLIPATAKRFGVKDSFDSQDNVEGGVKYLKYLIGLFHGDYARAVAAYNAGESAVSRYGGVPPYKETQQYVAQVTRNLEAARRAFVPREVKLAEAEIPAVTAETETSNPIIASVGPDGKVYYRTP